MATVDYPPDDFTLEVLSWLKFEIYPGLLNEPWTDRACTVWVCGSGGWVGLWTSGFAVELPPADRKEAIKQEIYRRINALAFPPEASPNTITGQLRVDGLGFRDNLGPVCPLLCHFGEAFSAFVRRPEAVLQELDLIKSAGYHGIRFWDVLGYHDQNRPGDATPWTAWAGREVTPVAFTAFSGRRIEATPYYYEKLHSFLAHLKDKGLVAHHSRGDLNAWKWEEILTHCTRVGEIQREVGAAVIALNESCNESWQNGVPSREDLFTIGDHLGSHAIRGTSAPDDGYGGETPDALNAFKRDVAIIHGYRGGESRNRIGHIHAVGYETLPEAHVPGWQGEPAGAGSGVSVGREESEEALILMAAMAHLTHQAWVYMSGHGVFWNGSIADMVGFRTVPHVLSYLPPDIMFWPQVIHGGRRWTGTRVFCATDDGSLRADQAFRGNEVVAIVYAGPGTWEIPLERGFEGEMIAPVSGERTPLRIPKGGRLVTAFERGRILVGKVI